MVRKVVLWLRLKNPNFLQQPQFKCWKNAIESTFKGDCSYDEILTFNQYCHNVPTNFPAEIFEIKWGLGNNYFRGMWDTFILNKALLHCDAFNLFGFRLQRKLFVINVMRKTSKSCFWREMVKEGRVKPSLRKKMLYSTAPTAQPSHHLSPSCGGR